MKSLLLLRGFLLANEELPRPILFHEKGYSYVRVIAVNSARGLKGGTQASTGQMSVTPLSRNMVFWYLFRLLWARMKVVAKIVTTLLRST